METVEPDVAILGAGPAGLRAAACLAEAGLRVRVFEKSRGPGGRTSTRRAEVGPFDHGAQYATLRAPSERDAAAGWEAAGALARWEPRLVDLPARTPRDPGPDPSWVGVPGMNALAKHLAQSIELVPRTRVAEVTAERALRSEDGADLGRYRAVLVAVPAPQAVPLLEAAPALAAAADRARMAPCWAVMAAWDEPLPLPFDGAFIDGGPLSWAARDASRPGRPPGERWVLHATPAWSQAHLEEPPEAVAPRLVEALAEAAGVALPAPAWLRGHRWRYARVIEPVGVDHLWDAGRRLGACGDWCRGARVEDALLSGAAAAAAVLESL